MLEEFHALRDRPHASRPRSRPAFPNSSHELGPSDGGRRVGCPTRKVGPVMFTLSGD